MHRQTKGGRALAILEEALGSEQLVVVLDHFGFWPILT
jgi:hypothetical protein